jgi:hypothetical protein
MSGPWRVSPGLSAHYIRLVTPGLYGGAHTDASSRAAAKGLHVRYRTDAPAA